MSISIILPPKKITTYALDLRQCMSDISEEYYFARWMTGLEFNLWYAMMRDGGVRYGQGYITQDDADALRDCSHRSGGWWYWPEREFEQLTSEPQFTDLRYWQRAYAEYEDDLYRIRRMSMLWTQRKVR